MLVTCTYYDNTNLLCLVMKNLLQQAPLTIIPVAGSYNVSDRGICCIGSYVEFVVTGAKQPLLLTNNPEHKSHNKQRFDYRPLLHDNSYSQIVMLLQQKYSNSHNMFTFECSGDGCTIATTMKDNKPAYIFKTPSGDMLKLTNSFPLEVYRDCKSMKSFSSLVVTDSSEKEVTVRKGQLEILRQIASYLNRVLVVVTHTDYSITSELYITQASCFERVTLKDGRHSVVRSTNPKLSLGPTAQIMTVEATSEEIRNSSGLPVLMRCKANA